VITGEHTGDDADSSRVAASYGVDEVTNTRESTMKASRSMTTDTTRPTLTTP
jgi:hypothetical protein